ncbi:MAG: hypothetical protein V1878_05455 [bacterium]
MNKTQTTALVYLAFAVCGVVLIANGVAVESTWLRYPSLANGIAVIIAVAFDRWLWKLPAFKGWLVKIPDISGTWRASLRTTWTSPGTASAESPLEGFLAVHQTLTSLRMRLMTSQSVSHLLGAQVTPAADGSSTIAAVYRNEPSIAVRGGSPIHHGAMLLYVPSKKEAPIKGTYWTDRATSGDIELSGRVKDILDDFALAKQAISPSDAYPDTAAQ